MFCWLRFRISSAVAFDLLEGREKLPEIKAPPLLQGDVRVQHPLQHRLVGAVKLLQALRLLPLAGQGDVAELRRQGRGEAGAVLLGDRKPLLRLAGQGEEGAAVHPLQSLLHLLAGDDALVVLAQDDVDRAAEIVEQRDALHSHGNQDRKQQHEAQGELGAQPEA